MWPNLLLLLFLAPCETNAFLQTNFFHPSKIVASASLSGMDKSEDDLAHKNATVTRLNGERASLAKVVAAFPPDGHALDLNHIEDAMVLEVDEEHIQVQATICEQESCSAVSVPLDFPRPCSGDLEECAMENLRDLYLQADLLLQQAEFDLLNHEQHAEIDRQRNELLDPSIHIDFPDWWVTPAADMIEECDTLQNLLNEAEFAPERCAMARGCIGEPVEHAAVCAIGPTGIIFRARLSSGEVEGTRFPFSITASRVDDLRTSVMAAMEDAGTGSI